jgi:short subunit fatty acids transporter
MIDILLPFAMYLVLGLVEGTILRNSVARGAIVFAIGAVTETLQFFNVPLFGQTFDLLDYLMFGVGILLGTVFERTVLSRIPV